MKSQAAIPPKHQLDDDIEVGEADGIFQVLVSQPEGIQVNFVSGQKVFYS